MFFVGVVRPVGAAPSPDDFVVDSILILLLLMPSDAAFYFGHVPLTFPLLAPLLPLSLFASLFSGLTLVIFVY
jgi:hypothetical protein